MLKTNANGAGIATGPTLTGPWLPRHASMSRRLGARRFRHSIRRSHRLCRSALAPASGMISASSSIPLGKAVRDRVASAPHTVTGFLPPLHPHRRSEDHPTCPRRPTPGLFIVRLRFGDPVRLSPKHRRDAYGRGACSVSPAFDRWADRFGKSFLFSAFRQDAESYLPFRPSKNAPHR